MISIEGISKARIRTHYEVATIIYRLLWGIHIHHGLWHANESSRQAQTPHRAARFRRHQADRLGSSVATKWFFDADRRRTVPDRNRHHRRRGREDEHPSCGDETAAKQGLAGE